MEEKSNETKARRPLKTVKIIVNIVSAIVTLVLLFFIFRYLFNTFNINPFHSGPSKLETVSNIQYDFDNYKLTWDKVDHADLYKIDINGNVQDLDTNSIEYVPAVVNTDIKIKAMDTSLEYLESDWSDTFTLQAKEDSIYAQLGTYMSKLLPDHNEIINAYIQDGSLFVNALYEDGGILKVYQLKIDYENAVTSIQDAVRQEVSNVWAYNKYDLANYDSALYLLLSKSYAGEMEQRRLEGYEFSVVASRVAKGNKDNIYYIYATYKLIKGAEVKYIQQVTECYIYKLTYSEKVNFTTMLMDLDNRLIGEKSYVELTGDALDLAMEMEKIHSIGKA